MSIEFLCMNIAHEYSQIDTSIRMKPKEILRANKKRYSTIDELEKELFNKLKKKYERLKK